MLKRFYPYGLLLFPLLLLILYGDQFLYLSGAKFSDLTISHLPNAIFLRRSLLEWGQIPLWSPGILSGFPFAANPLSGLFYPPGWFAVVWPEAWMFNLLAGLHLVWGGVGMALLLQKEGIGRVAAVFGGLTFALMPKLIAHYGAGHVTLVYAVAWTPWLLYGSNSQTESDIRNKSWILGIEYWPGVILAIIFFADVRWAAFAGVLWVGWWFLRFNRVSARLLMALVAQLLLAAALSAPLGLMLGEFVHWSTRSALSVQDVLEFSLPPARLLGLIFPEFGRMQEWVVYPGVVVLGLALAGLAWPDVRRKTRFWWGVWLAAVFFSLGEYLPGLSLLARLPGVSLLRVPSRAMFVAGMAMAGLAAFSLDHLLSGVGARARRQVTRVWVGLVGLGLAIAGGVWFLTGDLPLNFAWGAGGMTCTALGLGFLTRKRRLNPVWAGLLVIGIGLVDWGVVNGRSLSPHAAAVIFSEQAEVISYLVEQCEPFRVYSPSYGVPQHAAAREGLELANGVDPLQVASYSAFMRQASGVPQDGYSVTIPPFKGDVATANAAYIPDAEMLGLLNVRYVVAEFDLVTDGLALVNQFGETRVYENAFDRGRAWLEEGDGEISVSWSPNQITVAANGPGLLVLSEVWYPGWQVRVDGQEADLEQVEGVLRGVKIPVGIHQVLFDFRPTSLYLGFGLFGIAGVFLVVNKKIRNTP